MNGLEGRRILVIGASSGIGAQTAITLSERGAKVILAARREEKLMKVMDSLTPGEHAWYKLDVSDIDSIEGIVSKIVEDQGRLDGMAYTAGVTGDYPAKFLNYEKLFPVFQTNFFGFVECTRQCCKRKRFNQGLRIVAVSSVAALFGQKAHTAYSASKAAVDAAVRCMAKEYAASGICINSVAPSAVMTDMYRRFLSDTGADDNQRQGMLERQYLGMGEPKDIANAICFLLSPESRFITGITLPVDGGVTSSC